jgi:hypothetical protein
VDVLPPNSYTLSFEGQGGAAGFGKGTAKVNLAPPAEGAGCQLSYTAQAQVGGKIAQVGQRLVDGVAKSMAEDFFRRFDEEMQRQHPEAYAAEAALAQAAAEPQPEQAQGEPPPTQAPGAQVPSSAARRMPMWVWLLFGSVVLLALLLLVR